ncbi:putative c6 zinc finger domain protein [Neofusicoccum parvum UCRNP2]|uniref:Putative c6 zinc finger domain protein n=1 Tax=Botryosphaeria parva (strain UCR-NP2) TaxID=1287680 RepID=R1E8H0_BOTPV|nr:putative c6 zinc finger domain protein [Neofusicoccum parvum UCRNP2]
MSTQTEARASATGLPPRKKPKSRDGCQRCKLKRLKCDETKPDCRNCVNRGIVCPGYKKFIKWSTKYEAYMPDASRTLILGPNQLKEDKRLRNASRSTDLTKSSSPEEDTGSWEEEEERPRKRDREAEDDEARWAREEEESEAQRRAAAIEEHIARVAECVGPLREGSGGEVVESVETEDVQDGDAPAQPDVEPPPASTPSLPDFSEFDLPDIDFSGIDMPSLDLPTEPPEEEADEDVDSLELVSQSNGADYSWLSRELLRNFYGMNAAPSPGQVLVEPGMALVEHYFKNVCALYSSFDSVLNPFRTAVGRIWDSSPSVYYAIQSMAAAQLANFNPRMVVTGLELQRKAYQHLQDEMALVTAGCQSSERALLAILLLGLTACWHDEADLGLTHLAAARALIYPRLIAPVPPENRIIRRQNQFFEESLIYWEMLIGFVSQESAVNDSTGRHSKPWQSGGGLGPLGIASSFMSGNRGNAFTGGNKLLPHPWTGIAPNVQMLFAEVGRLIRHERLSQQQRPFSRRRGSPSDPLGYSTRPPPTSPSAQQEDRDKHAWATLLEEQLLSSDLPAAADLIDPGDAHTARRDFVQLGEAYRCAALLEVYRVYPRILKRRLGASSPSRGWEKTGICSLTPSTPGTAREDTDLRIWLNSLALHVLGLLEEMPHSSGTCSTQPILLVAAAGELRFVSSLDYFDLHANNEKVRRARGFVRERLREFAKRLPSKPLMRMMQLVEEVWRRLDAGEPDVFWLDVMWEKGWQTVMG